MVVISKSDEESLKVGKEIIYHLLVLRLGDKIQKDGQIIIEVNGLAC